MPSVGADQKKSFTSIRGKLWLPIDYAVEKIRFKLMSPSGFAGKKDLKSAIRDTADIHDVEPFVIRAMLCEQLVEQKGQQTRSEWDRWDSKARRYALKG